MVNNDRVALMTRLAIYENRFEREEQMLQHYGKEDYIRMHAIKTVLFSTIAFCLMIGLCFCVMGDNLLLFIREYSLKQITFLLVTSYVVFLWILIRVDRMITGRMYEDAKGRNYRQIRRIMDLDQMYQEEQLANYVAVKEKEKEINEPVISD